MSVFSAVLGSACQQAEDVTDRRNRSSGVAPNANGDAVVEESSPEGAFRLASPELIITMRQGANILEWNAIDGASRYDLYISLVDDVSLDDAAIIEGVISPYTHIKEPEVYYSYTVVAVDREPTRNSLPARFVNDIPIGLTATCLAYQGEAKRTMEAVLLSSGLRDCYQLATAGDEVVRLNLSSQNLIIMEPLKHLSNLEFLNLSDNLISDLGPLRDLNQLQSLNLNSNGVLENLEPLAGLVELETLRLSFNAIADLSAIAELKGLVAFEAAGNLLENVATVANFTKLESLSLANNPVVRAEISCPIVSVQALLAQFCYQGVTVSYAAHIQKMMNLHCVGCHANLGTEAGVIDWAEGANVHIQAGTMPQGLGPLSPVDMMIFAQWFANLPQE